MSAAPVTKSPEHSQKWNLQKKLKAFLRPRTSERNEICKFIDVASARGDTYIVGGLLRDLHIHGSRNFNSDIDLVMDQVSPKAFDSWMGQLGGKENRFGGYSLNVGPAKFDLWLLERTWARVAGYCDVRQPEDLHRTTFFDWDCILYSVTTGKIITEPGYFERVRRRILDIRLAQNPNPLGNAVRALRYACRYNADLSKPLVSHVVREIRDNGWQHLVRYEGRSFSSQYLEFMDGNHLYRRLVEHERSDEVHPFNVQKPPKQLGLY